MSDRITAAWLEGLGLPDCISVRHPWIAIGVEDLDRWDVSISTDIGCADVTIETQSQLLAVARALGVELERTKANGK